VAAITLSGQKGGTWLATFFCFLVPEDTVLSVDGKIVKGSEKNAKLRLGLATGSETERDSWIAVPNQWYGKLHLCTLLSSRTSPFTVKNTLCGDTSTNGEFLQNLSLVDTLHHLSLHEAVNVGFANEFVKFIAISTQNKCCMATVNQTHVVARA
jgi:hypothetical protein